MKKSTIMFTVLTVTAFLVATVLGLQNPNIPESQNESSETPEFGKDTSISYSSQENPDQNFSVGFSLSRT